MNEENFSPLLIFDKDGYIAGKLLPVLKEKTVFIVSGQRFSFSETVHPVLFRSRIPKIPDHRYTKIFFIYNGQDNILELFPAFAKKAKRDGAKLYFLCHKDQLTQKLAHTVLSSYDRSYLLLFGDILSSDAPSEYGGNTASLFSRAGTYAYLLLDGNGLRELYPVILSDLLLGISNVIFDEALSKRTYFLFPKSPLIELTIARMLHRREPLLKMDFRGSVVVKEEKHPKNFLEGRYILPSSYSIEKYAASFPLPAVKRQGKMNRKSRWLFSLLPGRLKKPRKSWLRLILTTLIIITIAPLLTTFITGAVAGSFLLVAKDTLAHGDFVKAKTFSSLASDTFFLAQKSYSIDELICSLIGKKELGKAGAGILDLGNNSARLIGFIADAGEKYSNVESGKSKNPGDDLLSATSAAQQAQEVYQKMKQQKYPFVFNPLSVSSTDIVDPDTVLSSAINVLPEILGIHNEKIYLVLFQNNMELRPGGGFIGSYGILRMKKGSMSSFAIHDVYDADGQLRGHIEPPFALRRYLPTAHLYFRDSNFSPDFSKSASSAAMLYQQETNQVVDGVIGVDSTFIQKLIGLVGPIPVLDYHETVTVDNFYLLTEKHAEKNFFPGSTQKKDFLRSLFGALQLRLENDKNNKISGLFKITYESLLEKHILLAFSDASFEQLLKVDHIASSLSEEQVKTDGISDFFGLNEANIGVDKANYFLKRKIEQRVLVQKDASVKEQVEVRYGNTSDSWPGGAYKTYLQFILPAQAVLTGIQIDAVAQKMVPAVTDPLFYEAKNFVPPFGLEVETTQEEGKTLYGFLLVVPAGAYKTVTISYSLPPENLAANRFSYNLLLFKQPGTLDDPYSLSVSYPKNYTSSTSFPNAVIQNGQLTYSMHLLHDSLISISFSSQ